MPAITLADKDHDSLRKLSQETGKTIGDLLHDAIREYTQAALLRAANEEFAAIRNDPQAWKEELEERRLWDATLMDGLDGEE